MSAVANMRPGFLPGFMRILDIALASLGLFLLSPLFAMIATAIRFGSPGPVLIRQSRTGPYIFRTAGRANQPVTWLGWFLRESSLDEIPQLLSLIKGDVSLVDWLPFPLTGNDGGSGERP